MTGWKIGKMTGTGTIGRIVRVNGTDHESTCLVCGVAGSNPSLNQQSKDKVKLMIDSGSQSTACSVDFAKGYATDDTERAKLWDIQDQKIEAHGKKIVDVKFHGQANETPVPASIKVDVSDVASNVASMGRLLRAGFDLHFTNHGHTCWRKMDDLEQRSVKTVQRQRLLSTVWMSKCCLRRENPAKAGQQQVRELLPSQWMTHEWKKAAEWNWLDLCEMLV